MEHDQIAKFLARAPSDPETENPDDTRTVFPSDLELDRESEDALMEEVLGQIRYLKEEMGRDKSYSEDWYSSATGNDRRSVNRNFMASRQLYDMIYHQKMEWRATVLGGIFAEHNLTVPLTRRICQQQHSRATDYFFSTDPWFAVAPVGVGDQDLAEGLNRYSRWKLNRSGTRDALVKAVELAFIRGEQVVKPGYTRRTSRYEETATVAVGGPGGEPLLAEDGDYIFADDLMVSQVGGQELTDEAGNPMMALKRHPSELWPADYEFVWEERKVWREVVLEDGVEIANVYYKDFLCDPNEESVQSAPCAVHLYDQPAFEVAHKYMEAGDPADLNRVIDLMREWESADGTPKAEARRPRPELGETGSLSDTGGSLGQEDKPDTVVEIAEVYIRYDANNDGLAEEIFILVDMANERPVYYNYLANVTPDAKRPFHVVRINPVDGRWHGIGTPETFFPLQEHVDLLINRWNQAQSSSGWIDVINPNVVKETDADGNVDISGGDAYHLNEAGFKAEDFFTRIFLHDNRSDDIREQIEFDMQLAMNMSGISNTNDNNLAGMDTTKLATGIRNIERSGQELFGPFLGHLDPGISGAVKGALQLIIANLDEAETYEFFEGDDRVVAEFKPEAARDIDLDVTMELTRYKGEQEITQLQYAKASCNEFYELPPDRQMLLASLYRNELKRYGIKNADELIQPGAAMPMGMLTQPDPSAAATASPPPGPQENL